MVSATVRYKRGIHFSRRKALAGILLFPNLMIRRNGCKWITSITVTPPWDQTDPSQFCWTHCVHFSITEISFISANLHASHWHFTNTFNCIYFSLVFPSQLETVTRSRVRTTRPLSFVYSYNVYCSTRPFRIVGPYFVKSISLLYWVCVCTLVIYANLFTVQYYRNCVMYSSGMQRMVPFFSLPNMSY